MISAHYEAGGSRLFDCICKPFKISHSCIINLVNKAIKIEAKYFGTVMQEGSKYFLILN